jgi:crotonobetainyl-CoA:carnitine CoA-transferase CaiB-like acyl-CoA transferase
MTCSEQACKRLARSIDSLRIFSYKLPDGSNVYLQQLEVEHPALRPYRQERKIMRPLEDVRVIAIEQYGAGPFGTVHLADMGAEIIKIEDPRAGGDVGRYVPPFQEGEDSLFFETFNRNKRSLSLDITTTAGRAVFEDLVKVSDAVYSNLRGDVPARLT